MKNYNYTVGVLDDGCGKDWCVAGEEDGEDTGR